MHSPGEKRRLGFRGSGFRGSRELPVFGAFGLIGVSGLRGLGPKL